MRGLHIIFMTYKTPNLFLIRPSAQHVPIARFRRDQKRKPLLVNLCHDDIITPTIDILGAKINNDNTVDNTQKIFIAICCVCFVYFVVANSLRELSRRLIASGLKNVARVDPILHSKL